MARVQDNEYTLLSDDRIAASGIGTSPEGIAAYSDLQRAVFEFQPADTADAQAAAVSAAASADQAQAAADSANGAAGTAQTRADAAYDLAGTKVSKNYGPTFSAPTATPSRAPLPAYTAGTAGAVYTEADVQGLMDQVAALTSRLAAVIADGRANGVFTT